MVILLKHGLFDDLREGIISGYATIGTSSRMGRGCGLK